MNHDLTIIWLCNIIDDLEYTIDFENKLKMQDKTSFLKFLQTIQKSAISNTISNSSTTVKKSKLFQITKRL